MKLLVFVIWCGLIHQSTFVRPVCLFFYFLFATESVELGCARTNSYYVFSFSLEKSSSENLSSSYSLSCKAQKLIENFSWLITLGMVFVLLKFVISFKTKIWSSASSEHVVWLMDTNNVKELASSIFWGEYRVLLLRFSCTYFRS